MDTSVGIREFSGLQHSRCSKMQGADVRGARVHSSIFQPWHDVVTCCMSMWGKEFTMKWQTDVFGATSHNHTHPTMSRYRNPGMGGTLVKGKVIMPKVFLLSMFLISRWWCWCTRLTCKTDRSSYTRLTQLIPNMAKSITRDVMASLKPRWTWARDNTTCGRIPVGNDKDKGQHLQSDAATGVLHWSRRAQAGFGCAMLRLLADSSTNIWVFRANAVNYKYTYFVRSFGLPLLFISIPL